MKILLPIDIEHINQNFKNELIANLKSHIDIQNSSVDLLYIIEQLPSYESVLSTLDGNNLDIKNRVFDHANKLLVQLVDDLNNHFKKISFKIEIGLYSEIITKYTSRGNYDLIAVKLKDNIRIDERLFGRISRQLLHLSQNSILFFKNQLVYEKSSIVIGIDGSDYALESISKANNLLNFNDNYNQIYLTSVVHLPSIVYAVTPHEYSTIFEADMVAKANLNLAKALNYCNEHNIKNASIKLLTGSIAQSITQFCDDIKANLIILASHGVHKNLSLDNLLTGSLSEELLSTSKNQQIIVIK